MNGINEEHIAKMRVLQSLTLSEFVSELNQRIYENEEEKQEIVRRQVELEQCVYSLLSRSKPTADNYGSVLSRLEKISQHLRNPDLLNKAQKRASHDSHR